MTKKAHRFARRGPDLLLEEIASVLSGEGAYEFKALFLTVQSNLKERSVGKGDAEMFRLRTYEKLQNMVQQGVVTKTGKSYAGNKGLAAFRERLAAQHCRELLQVVVAAPVAAAAKEGSL